MAQPRIGDYEIVRLARKVRPFGARNLKADGTTSSNGGLVYAGYKPPRPWGVAKFDACVRAICMWQALPLPDGAEIERLRQQLDAEQPG
jgi:hypothetical protein